MYKVSSIWIKELCTTTTSLIYHQNENRTELEDNNNNKENGFFSDTFGFQPISPYQQGAEALQKEKINLETSAYYLPGSLFTTIMHYCCSQ
jgi:hypothetical protein